MKISRRVNDVRLYRTVYNSVDLWRWKRSKGTLWMCRRGRDCNLSTYKWITKCERWQWYRLSGLSTHVSRVANSPQDRQQNLFLHSTTNVAISRINNINSCVKHFWLTHNVCGCNGPPQVPQVAYRTFFKTWGIFFKNFKYVYRIAANFTANLRLRRQRRNIACL